MRTVLAALTILAVGTAASPSRSASLTETLELCSACHGEKGQSETPEVPSLGAQNAPYTLIQIYLFRAKQRVFAPMNEATQALTDDDLRNLSDAIAKLPPPHSAEGAAEPRRLDAGRALAARYHCNICHLADFAGQENVPRIAAQREDYLVKTLREYKSNARIGYDATMAEALQPVADSEILDLAYFIARQP
jgi:cytochrome c553